ncbi:efflux transporter outer membrane subunit [Azomonas macrocytogenes]|uniref:NodT family efflux transporter outer membrane factor (OMF) lipoprotein n=1 Tax=Azomonas macrocytogenes TaxID=69962 RepID=A0A839SZJ6_AZOMA|nr:efflux transporter outer membrane subunit [Azomonas macrocytogenes]MBB3101700.1 NodT family efflux transporter outer membrane factor (OMF) lipoprotein [Azomonas macrocytogenes]
MLAFMAMLGGCTLVPTYHQPELPLASNWTGNESLPAQPVAGGQWWREFHSTELDSLITRGLTQNYTLQAAASRIEQARAITDVVQAGQWPSVSLGGLYQKQNNYSTRKKRSVFAETTYEADFWGKHRAATGSAKALVQASSYDAQTLRMTVGASIADTYFLVLSLEERLHLAQSIAADAQQVLKLIQVHASLGASSNLEIEQQRNVQQTFAAAVPWLAQLRNQALFQLAILVGAVPEGFRLEQSGLGGIRMPKPDVGLPIALLRQRPDILAAEARLQSAHFDVGVARAAFLPNVSLDLLRGVDTLGNSPIWSVMGILSQPVFMGGLLTGQLHADRAHVQELMASYRESVIEALQDVETQLSATQQLSQAYTIHRAAVDSAREAARLAQIRYRLGASDFQTLLIAERSRYQAEDSLLQVHLQYLQSAVGLFRALGGDFTPTASAATTVSSTSSVVKDIDP